MKKIENINKIVLLNNVCLNRDIHNKKFYKFITIETNNDVYICDLTNGIDYSNISREDKNIALLIDLTEIYALYNYNESSYQSEIEFENIESIILHIKATLKNEFNGSILKRKVDIIEFKDKNDNKFFLLPKASELYMRNKIYGIKDSKKKIPLFIKDEKIDLDMKIIDKYVVSVQNLKLK